MEKTREEERVEIIHEFYCDKCGAFIGESDEYDDGWYEEPGEYSWDIRGAAGTWNMKGHYCQACFEKVNYQVVSTIGNTLKALGFKKT